MMGWKIAGAALALSLAAALPAAAQERTLPTVSYTVLHAGPKAKPAPVRVSAVQIRYTGRLEDGSVFDTSDGKGGPDNTAIFPLRGLIGGFQAALMQMQPGDKWRVRIPPQFAYGQAGHPLAGKTLIFDLELVDWADVPATPPPVMTALPAAK